MLSRLIAKSITKAFSTSPAVRSSAGAALAQRAGLSEVEKPPVSASELRELQQVVQSERSHLANYANDLREQLNDRIAINFAQPEDGKTLIFESLPDGSSNSKLAQILVIGSLANLWNLLLGFPSYLALGGTLGMAGVGAVWSYSNYLRRSAPQITQIFQTGDGRLEVHYLKPGFLSRGEGSFTVDANSYRQVSFGCNLTNYVRKANRTAWVQVDGKLFWYANNDGLRLNNHHLL